MIFICSSHVNYSRKKFHFQKSRRLYVLVVKHIFRIHSYSIFHPLNNSHFPYRNKEGHGNFKRCCICLFPSLWWWYPRWWLMSKLVKFYTLYMHSSLYSNYISVKLKKKSKEDDKYSTAERTGQSLLSICIHYKKKRERERASVSTISHSSW